MTPGPGAGSSAGAASPTTRGPHTPRLGSRFGRRRACSTRILPPWFGRRWLTNGHVWMVEQGANLFDRLVVAVGINPDKKYEFSLSDRLSMLRESLKRFNNVSVTSFSNQYLINYAQSIGATHILRGIRSESDYEFERTMRNINGDLDGKICSVFLMPPRNIAEVSSSMVKGLVGPTGWQKVVKQYVPAPVYRLLKAGL